MIKHYAHARSKNLNTGLVDEAFSDIRVCELTVGRSLDAGFTTFKTALQEQN